MLLRKRPSLVRNSGCHGQLREKGVESHCPLGYREELPPLEQGPARGDQVAESMMLFRLNDRSSRACLGDGIP